MAKKKQGLKRGYGALKTQLGKDNNRLKCVRSCQSCMSYYSDDVDNIDASEECHNSEVTSFDYIQEDGKSYCCFWKPPWANENS